MGLMDRRRAQQFLDDILVPTLRDMEGMWTPAAEKLLLMTAAHESGRFRHDRQLGGGPALSFYQIEPATLKDLYLNFLAYRPPLRAQLDQFKPSEDCSPEEALMDPVYATAAARMIYYRVPQPLPDRDDEEGLMKYWKTFYNTHLGKGTPEKMAADWEATRPKGYR